MLIESRGETSIITGDAIHHPSQANLKWAGPDEDVTRAFKSRESLLSLAHAKSATLIGTHFAPPVSSRVTLTDEGEYRIEPL